MRPEFLQPSTWSRASDQRPDRGVQTLHREATVPTDLDQTFAFFADAQNLERLTPPWLSFRIATPLPIEMKEGALIDYVIELYGVPIPWRTRIDVWEPGVRFVDRQIAGPYRWWRHEHRFEALDRGTRSDRSRGVSPARRLAQLVDGQSRRAAHFQLSADGACVAAVP